jgi:hypothetical protein
MHRSPSCKARSCVVGQGLCTLRRSIATAVKRFLVLTRLAATSTIMEAAFSVLQQSLNATADKLEKFSKETSYQLAQMTQALSALQGMLSSCATKKEDTITGSSMAAAQVQHRHQRARVTDDHMRILAVAEVADAVLSFVGVGDYYYIAGVCKTWRERYMLLCDKAAKDGSSKFNTCRNSIVLTAARLQLALDDSLTLAQLELRQDRLANAFVRKSFEPTKALTIARLYGLQWSNSLSEYAAIDRNYELLRWLHKCGCPCNVAVIGGEAIETHDFEHMKQIFAITGPWPGGEPLTEMMWEDARLNKLDNVKWCREQGADWPNCFFDIQEMPFGDCWSLRCVQWAIANGSTWCIWRCRDLAPRYYRCAKHFWSDCSPDDCTDDCCDPMCRNKQARALFTWAHENGCPCTCNEDVA